MTIPDRCARAGCTAPVETWCPLCDRCFCTAHDRLPDGHACLAAFNASRCLELDEIPAALERFRPFA
jgi:hypothetical protein